MTVAAILAFFAAWGVRAAGGLLGGDQRDRRYAEQPRWHARGEPRPADGDGGGALMGAACVSLRGRTFFPEILVMILAVGPTALLAALRPSFRLAPMTAVIVLVGASPGAGLITAFHRVAEIMLGCVIGALTAHLVLPDRAREAIKVGAAGVLDGLGKVVTAHVAGADAARIDALNEVVRRHLSATTTAVAEDVRERALAHYTGPPAASLLRTLRRVRSDVAFIGRAMALEPGKVDATIGEVLARHFTDAAAFLRGTGSAPALATLDAVIGTVPSDSVLGFVLVTLRRDLADLDERLAERVRSDDR